MNQRNKWQLHNSVRTPAGDFEVERLSSCCFSQFDRVLPVSDVTGWYGDGYRWSLTIAVASSLVKLLKSFRFECTWKGIKVFTANPNVLSV